MEFSMKTLYKINKDFNEPGTADFDTQKGIDFAQLFKYFYNTMNSQLERKERNLHYTLLNVKETTDLQN